MLTLQGWRGALYDMCYGLSDNFVAYYTLALTMTPPLEHIAVAGNTEVPASLAIRKLGFSLSREPRGENDEWWIAANDELRFVAGSPLELLGLITMRRESGAAWQATDEDIRKFLSEFYSEGREK